MDTGVAKPQIFLDCDGVLADFDGRAAELLGMPSREYEKVHGPGRMWAKVYSKFDFFLSLDLLDGAEKLVEAVRSHGVDPIILTGLPSGGLKQAQEQKLAWRDKHFPGVEMITCMSRDKCKYGRPGDIIIDDWEKWKHRWVGMGGLWITHTSVDQSLISLEQHMSVIK